MTAWLRLILPEFGDREAKWTATRPKHAPSQDPPLPTTIGIVALHLAVMQAYCKEQARRHATIAVSPSFSYFTASLGMVNQIDHIIIMLFVMLHMHVHMVHASLYVSPLRGDL